MFMALFLLIIRKTQGIIVPIENSENTLYTIHAYIGSPEQEFVLAVDTSQWLWIDRVNCAPCHEYLNRFDPSKSSTYTTQQAKIFVEFEGGIVQGLISTDIIKVEAIEATRIEFVLGVKDYDLDAFNADGVFGLGVCVGSEEGFIMQAYLNGAIEEPVLGVFFSDNGFSTDETKPKSALSVGEVDFNYTRDVNGSEITRQNGWEITMQGVVIGNNSFPSNSYANITAASQLIVGPKEEIVKIQRFFMTRHGCGFESHGFLVCECRQLQVFNNITLILNNLPIVLTPTIYFLKSQGYCYLLLVYLQDSKSQFWTLGMPFLREYYTVFDYEDQSISVYPAVRSRVDVDDSTSIVRWVVITIVILAIVVLWVSLYIIYALYCKNPHRWLNTNAPQL